MAIGGLVGFNPSVNSGMQVPGKPPCGGSMANQGPLFAHLNSQSQIDQVAIQDYSLAGLAQQGSLNKNEFVNLSAQQNELARLSGEYAADGVVTDQERAKLNALRSRFQQDLAMFRTGDYNPATQEGRKGIAGTQDRQSAFLFDNIRNGNLTPAQALNLRQQMSASAFSQGIEGASGASGDSQIANVNGRLANIWGQLGAAASEPKVPQSAIKVSGSARPAEPRGRLPHWVGVNE